MLVRTFSKIGKNDAAIAGGKGASLGEMTNAGIPVPPGFVVLADAFEKFLVETDLNVEIDSILHAVNPKEMHTVEYASEKIQALILAAQMPKDIAVEIEKYFTELGAEYVAVRSSATAEDSASAAWAGQLDTFLNATHDDLLTNVQRCWASLFTPRAIFYRFEKELHTQKISVAVVVQKMVQSEISGIAFSVHPVTEDRNQLIIEAGWGLGEAIVSGAVTPDSYVVEKEPRRIIDINASTQTRALSRLPKPTRAYSNVLKNIGISYDRNHWVEIAEPKASAQKLTNEQILELSELVVKIENHYGFPCDIEWAYVEKKFYITQSRPITTLSQTQSIAKNSKIALQKYFTRPHSLFYAAVWRESNCKRAAKWIGRNIEEVLFLRRGESDEVEVWYSDFELEEYRRCIQMHVASNPKWFEKVVAAFEEHWSGIEKHLSHKNPLSKEEFKDFYNDWLPWWEPMAIMMQTPEIVSLPQDIRDRAYTLRAKTQEHSDAGDEVYLLYMRKHHPTLLDYYLVLMPEEVFAEQFPDRVVLEQRKQGWFMTNDAFGLIVDLPAIVEQRNFLLEQFALFEKQFERDTCLLMQVFFARGLAGENYLGFGVNNPYEPIIFHYFNGENVEMWENNAAMQWFGERLLQKNIEEPDFIEKVVADQRKVLERIQPLWKKPSLTQAEIEEYLALARRGVENVIFYFFSGMDERMPEHTKKLAAKIRAEDDFMANNDIYIRRNIAARGYPDQYADMLLPDEFKELPAEAILKERLKHTLLVGGKELIATSLKDYAREHPELLFKDLEATADQNQEIRGQVAYKGIIQGPVKIVRNRLQMEAVQEGDILVSPMTTPDFMPAMQRAAAFVTDEGGIVCHAAIVAREMKKPCIIGTKIATQLLHDGDMVEVDATTGIVRKLN